MAVHPATFRTAKACFEARVLPEGVRVAVEVEVAETAARLRQRDVRGEIRADDIADVEEDAIRKGS